MPARPKVQNLRSRALAPRRPPKAVSLTRATSRKNDRLLATIRDLAQQQQREQSQIFLSLRDAARTFKVPVSAAAEVYRRLSEEGVLSTVRGSRTMLRGKSTGRFVRINGMIGIPVSVRRFVTLRDYRECYLHLREELFARRFATRCVFYDGTEPDTEFLVSKFAKADVETVIWILPDGSARETALRLRDRGIQFIGISFAALPGILCRYAVRRRQAIGTIFRNWREQAKIRTATIIRAHDETELDHERIKRIESLAVAERIECEFAVLSKGDLPAPLKSFCRYGRGLVMPSPAASLLARLQPEAVTEVLGTCRVALIDGPIDVPASQCAPHAAADIVTVNWRPIARKIASDAETGEALSQAESVIFEAKPLLRVPLHKLLRSI